MLYSVSSYSFAQYIKAGRMTQLDVVEKARELGFDAVEFTDLKPNESPSYMEQSDYARLIKEKADMCGIKIIAYTIGATMYQPDPALASAEVSRLCGQVDIAALLGAKIMRHDVCYRLGKSGNSRSFDLMLPNIAENIRRVAEYAAGAGIRTCVENHGYIAQDSDRMERLFNAVNHENFGLLVDIGNFVCADENPVTAVSRVAPYAIHVHIKDMIVSSGSSHDPGTSQTRGCNYFRGTIVGQGSVPVRQCINILKRAGYSGDYTIEFEGAEDCIYGISKGLENLKNYMQG
jgi:sugar phosphate isomerase/epimerase